MKKDNNIQTYRRVSGRDCFKILESQNYKCAICGKTEEENGRRLAIDHDHETGEIRGLLCRSCNLGIGYMKESILIMAAASEYIKHSGTGIFISEKTRKDHYKANGKTEWRNLSKEDRENIISMSAKNIQKLFPVSKSTSYNWKKYRQKLDKS